MTTRGLWDKSSLLHWYKVQSSSTLAWKIPWMEEPGGLAVHRVARSRTWLSDFTCAFHFHALEKAMAAHSSVLAWSIPGTGEPGGLPSTGSHSRTRLERLSSSKMQNWKAKLEATQRTRKDLFLAPKMANSSNRIFFSSSLLIINFLLLNSSNSTPKIYFLSYISNYLRPSQ